MRILWFDKCLQFHSGFDRHVKRSYQYRDHKDGGAKC